MEGGQDGSQPRCHEGSTPVAGSGLPSRFQKAQLTVLYDLSVDVGERENLALSHPEIAARLEAELDKWTSQLAEPLWTSRRSSIDELDGQMVQVYF